MVKILISSCLLGERVRYHGGDAALDDPILEGWRREGRLVPFCPEVAGGLGVPRPPAEIQGAGGIAVLRGRARVVTSAGADVTDAFLIGTRALVGISTWSLSKKSAKASDVYRLFSVSE